MTGTTNGSANDQSKKTVGKETHRQYTINFKRRIVEETFAPGESVSIVARRHNINANLVFGWRKKYREGTLVDGKRPAAPALPESDLIRIGVVDTGKELCAVPVSNNASVRPLTPVPVSTESPAPEHGTIEIELPNRVKVRIAAYVNEAALRRVLAVARQQA
jgi:transposase